VHDTDARELDDATDLRSVVGITMKTTITRESGPGGWIYHIRPSLEVVIASEKPLTPEEEEVAKEALRNGVSVERDTCFRYGWEHRVVVVRGPVPEWLVSWDKAWSEIFNECPPESGDKLDVIMTKTLYREGKVLIQENDTYSIGVVARISG